MRAKAIPPNTIDNPKTASTMTGWIGPKIDLSGFNFLEVNIVVVVF